MSIKDFVKQWSGHGYEKGEAQTFWLTLIRDVFNIDKPESFIKFEEHVASGFIDGYFPDSKVLVEQKSSNVNLDDTEIFAQAKRYNDALEYSRKARWIVTCNFSEFLIYDMETLEPPVKILLEELPAKYHLLDFLIDPTQNKLRMELELSLQAGEIVAKIYDALLAQYINPNASESLASLNKLCVRLVFCLYAESAGIFGKHKIFRDYLRGARNIRRDLLDLFETLNTPLDKRDPYLDDILKKFPYVNGGLFEGAIEIPNFTPEIRELLLEEASSGFNWSGISPTIFGAVFESTLNPETRRAGGMHYTSIENIHKVIDPLFMEDLRAEFANLKTKRQLAAFHDKLANIRIFDPACGSGNFLTESYLSLRRLENELLKVQLGGQIQLGELDNPIKVSIGQFYGIEINDFAVAVAQTALWIAELQMMIETREIIHRDLNFLPLKSYANIVKANALRIDWQKVFPISNENSITHCALRITHYIIGNPPFVGKSFQTSAQKADLANVFAGINGYGNLDYVAAWYKKAADFIDDKISCAFVSTNSISQGIAVPPLWTYLFDKGVVVNFVHQTFKWTSESHDLAAVHCVVVGFAKHDASVKKIFAGKSIRVVPYINAYLLDAPNVIVLPRATPLRDDVPPMFVGCCPTDGGNLILTADEREDLIAREPAAAKWIRRYVGSNEFINGISRFCLWLKDCPPNELRKMPRVMERVTSVRDFRLASKKAATRRRADTPTLFAEDRFVDAPAIIIPMLSSCNRKYIPIGFVDVGVVVNIQASFIPNGDLYIFGIITSSFMMAWIKTVGGQFKSDYRFSPTVVYNTFPWCEPTAAQRKRIEATAQGILSTRDKYQVNRLLGKEVNSTDNLTTNNLITYQPNSLKQATLADLYDPLTMPADLQRAHRANDKAVAAAYGFEEILDDEPAIIAELFRRYEELTN